MVVYCMIIFDKDTRAADLANEWLDQ